MNYLEFLDKIIEDGKAAARRDYEGHPNKQDMLKGSLDGFEACRGKTPLELKDVLERAHRNAINAMSANAPNYWRIRAYELEVEGVCNVISTTLVNQGLPPIVHPTARAYLKAASLLNGEGCLIPINEVPA